MCLEGIPYPFHKVLKGLRFNWWLFEKNNEKRWNYLSLNKLEICSACLAKKREVNHSSKKRSSLFYETGIVKAYTEIKRKVFQSCI